MTASMLMERIKDAFEVLREHGYFAQQDWWCCQSCGVTAVPDEACDDGQWRYVFYHGQDTQNIADALREGRRPQCYLSWAGAGEEIAAEMRAAGLDVEWDGSDDRRICVPEPTH
jgi:hypothetical protein